MDAKLAISRAGNTSAPGSFDTFAAQSTNVSSQKQRRSLRRARTGKMRTLPSFVFRTSLTQHRFALALGFSLRCSPCRGSGYCLLASRGLANPHFRRMPLKHERRGQSDRNSFTTTIYNQRAEATCGQSQSSPAFRSPSNSMSRCSPDPKIWAKLSALKKG